MKNTKKALLLSVMSLVLCLSMLVGTTFAWFTDSVSTAKNTIASGNLDIELEYSKDFQNWNTVAGKSDLVDPLAKWEPGHTEVVYLRISNLGSLALKYQFNMTVANSVIGKSVLGNEIKLADYLKYDIVAVDAKFADRDAARAEVGEGKTLATYADAGSMKAGDAPKTYALVVYMPETVGNEANHVTGTAAPTIDLGLNLVATQLMAEEDSFNETYDKDAWGEGFQVFSAADLQAAINSGETEIVLMADIAAEEAIVIPEGADVKLDLNGYDINIETAYSDAAPTASSAVVNNGKLTLIGEGTIKALNNYTVRNYGEMIIDGITVENGIMNFADLTVESGNISNSRSGKHTIYGNAATLTINGGEFYNGNPGNAAIFAYGGEVAINGGEFSIADGTATLGWTSCLLDAQGGAKYAITGGEINGEIRDYNKNTQVTGGIFGHASVKNFLAAGYKTVENNGKYAVVPENVDKVIATAADLAALSAKAFTGNNGTAESYVIALVADIDMGGAEISAMIAQRGDSLEFLGNGHTISNAKIVSGADDNSTGSAGMFYAYNNSTLKVSDLTLKDITVTSDENSTGYAAAVIGYCEGAAILENVDVVNAKVTGAKSSGLLAGHVGNGGTLAATDCDVNGTVTISDYEAAGHYAGKVIGTVAGDITLNGVTYDATVGGNLHANNVGGIYGRKVSGNLTIDGGESIADGITKGANNTYSISNANGLATMNAMMADKSAGRDAIVKLTSDIDFTGKTWTMVDSHADSAFELLELDGQGHTISNFNISGQAMFSRFAGTGDVTIRDITFDNATVNNAGINCSVLTVQTYQNILLDNVDVKNSSITGAYKVAPLMGTVYNEAPSAITATVKNCDISNTVVTTTQFDFCTTGMIAFVYEGNADRAVFENCTVSGVKLCSVGNGYASHAWVYVNDADTDDCFNEVAGVTVTGCTFENK